MKSRSEAGKKKRNVRDEAEAAAAGVDIPVDDQLLDAAEAATEARDANHDGLALTVTWGEEGHIPKQYHTFKVGPLSAVVQIPPGKSVTAVAGAVYAQLEAIGDEMFEQKLAGYLGRQKRATGGR